MGRKLHLLSAAPRAPVAGGESARRTSSRFPAGARPAPALHGCRLDDAAAGTPPPAPHQLRPACPHAASLPLPADRWPGEPAAGLLGRLGRGSPPRAARTCCCAAATAAGEKVLVLLISDASVRCWPRSLLLLRLVSSPRSLLYAWVLLQAHDELPAPREDFTARVRARFDLDRFSWVLSVGWLLAPRAFVSRSEAFFGEGFLPYSACVNVAVHADSIGRLVLCAVTYSRV
ncbi:hypothetical protein ZWY2020_024250 [Hordeum vulgare]|nr:hypothetical protein ZWY2020_024250 [Hordeum vulgare]